jgi:hypothetical protein
LPRTLWIEGNPKMITTTRKTDEAFLQNPIIGKDCNGKIYKGKVKSCRLFPIKLEYFQCTIPVRNNWSQCRIDTGSPWCLPDRSDRLISLYDMRSMYIILLGMLCVQTVKSARGSRTAKIDQEGGCRKKPQRWSQGEKIHMILQVILWAIPWHLCRLPLFLKISGIFARTRTGTGTLIAQPTCTNIHMKILWG